jgi:hypothetical protein
MRLAFNRPVLLLTTMAAVVVVLGCGSASSAVSAPSGPTPAKCQPQLNGSSIVAAGGAGALSITTQPECAWSAASQVGWITNLSPASGQGSSQLEFRVEPNPSAATRTGEIAVNDGRIQIVQEGAPCVFDVRPGNLTIGPGGGSIATTVSAATGCAWTASVNVPWITVTAGARGNGGGAATFSIAANTGPLRSANITVAGQTFAVTQDASGKVNSPGPAPSPAPAPDGNSGGGENGNGKGKGKGKK